MAMTGVVQVIGRDKSLIGVGPKENGKGGIKRHEYRQLFKGPEKLNSWGLSSQDLASNTEGK